MTEKEFDKMLNDAAAVVAQEMAAEAEGTLEGYEKFEFSDRHKAVMDQVFAEYRANEKKKRHIKTVKRAAIILIACFTMFGATVFCVKGLRIKFLNYILEMYDSHTELKYENPLETEELELDYIPEGFQLKEYSNEGYIFLNFEKAELYFHIIARNEDLRSNIDTEDAFVERIVINGAEVLLSEKNDLIILAFHDQEFYYTVSGNIGKAEIIKIAENLHYKE